MLEGRLLEIINCKFDLIHKICNEFEKLRGDKHGIDNERDVTLLSFYSLYNKIMLYKFYYTIEYL